MAEEQVYTVSVKDNREITDNITAEDLKKDYQKEVKGIWKIFYGALALAVIMVGATAFITHSQNKKTEETVKKYKNELQANINNYPMKVYINKAGDFENYSLNGKPRSEAILEKAESYYSTKYSDLITTIAILIGLFGVGFPVALYFIQISNNNNQREHFKEEIKDEKDRIYENINNWVKERTDKLELFETKINDAELALERQRKEFNGLKADFKYERFAGIITNFTDILRDNNKNKTKCLLAYSLLNTVVKEISNALKQKELRPPQVLHLLPMLSLSLAQYAEIIYSFQQFSNVTHVESIKKVILDPLNVDEILSTEKYYRYSEPNKIMDDIKKLAENINLKLPLIAKSLPKR